MTIGFDLDDVLLDFNGALHPYHNAIYGTNYSKEHVRSYDLNELWGCTKEEAKRRVLEFYDSAEHWNAEPVLDAVEAINNLKDHKLFIITTKPEELRDRTAEWLDKYFGNSFDGIHFSNQYHGNGLKRTKSEICNELGVEIFVDDTLNNANDVASSGIPVLLLNTPWNQGELSLLITRVHSWPEIVQILSNKSFSNSHE